MSLSTQIPEEQKSIVGQQRYQTDINRVVLSVDVPTAIQDLLTTALNIQDKLEIKVSKEAPTSEVVTDMPSSIIITQAPGEGADKFISEKISINHSQVSIHVIVNDPNEKAYETCVTLANKIKSIVFAKDWVGTAIKWSTPTGDGWASPPTSINAYYILNYKFHWAIQMEELDQGT